MDRLPEEVILHVLSFLNATDIIHFQAISQRCLALGRDNALWKTETFNDSRAEALRRRRHLLESQEAKIRELRDAFSSLPGADFEAVERTQRYRALANWEPGYPNEKLDYYEEYLHRHAPITVGWLSLPNAPPLDKEVQLEATGIGTIANSQTNRPDKVVAPLDDGSICIWDLSARTTTSSSTSGKLLGQSKRGLLTGLPQDAISESHVVMTETGAVECVAVDSVLQKGYFGVQNRLHEVDLSTLQLISTKQYPWPITALSEAKERTPVTVGTNLTIHLHDPRDPAFAAGQTSTDGELIGGSVYSHANLAQPGPLSILHQDDIGRDDSSIWVAGRFTSLLNYDRRFFPRLRGTIFSGARIASLSSLPYPLIPQELDLIRNPSASMAAFSDARSQPGMTMLAAAEYKGKGSLELYGLPRVQPYQNRQTASASKLLSVAPHGGRIVFSDGDGNMKWVERDGFTHVRTFNINDKAFDAEAQDASAYGIWSSTASEMPGQGDIVQKIVPTQSTASAGGATASERTDINQSNLLLWTGDGALGVLGFGHDSPLGLTEEWHDAVESQAEAAEQKARDEAEKGYELAMRRALERNADEVRFVRGLGMGFMEH